MHNGSKAHIPDFDVEGSPCVYVHVFRGPGWSGEFSVALSRTKENEVKTRETWEGVMKWVKESTDDDTLSDLKY